MGIFDSIFGSNEKTTSGTSTTSVPQWVQNAGQQNYAALQRAVNKPYQKYTGARVAGTSNLEDQAFNMLQNGAKAGTMYGEASDALRRSMNIGPGSVSMPSDLAGDYMSRENPYKSIEDYMNPYTDAVLTPILRNIEEQRRLSQNSLAAEATGAGAFGDARHGFEGAQISQDAMTAGSDATGQVYSAAFSNAQAARQAAIAQALGLQQQDITNRMTAEGTNAGLREQYAGRLASGGTGLAAIQGAQTQNQLDWANALAGAGQVKRSIDQANKDFQYAQFLEGRDWDQNSLNILMSALNGTPMDRKTITSGTTSGGDNGLGSIIGGILGSIF